MAVLLWHGCTGISAPRLRVSLARRARSSSVLVVVVRRRMSHGGLQQSFVVSPCLDELFVELRKVIYHIVSSGSLISTGLQWRIVRTLLL